MCPACVAAMGLYVAGGLSAGAGATVLAGKWLRKQPQSTASTTSNRTEGADHAATDDRNEG